MRPRSEENQFDRSGITIKKKKKKKKQRRREREREEKYETNWRS